MDARLVAHRAVLELNQRLVHNCLAGIDDSEAWSGSGSGVGAVVTHLVAARGFLLRLVGGAPRQPLLERLDAAKAIDELDPKPALGELLELWDELSSELTARLDLIESESLSARLEQDFPLADPTLLGGLAFLSHHESYHIGQLGLLRRQLGHRPMSYGEPAGNRG